MFPTYSKVSDQLGPLNEFISPQPRMSMRGPQGIISRPITKQSANIQPLHSIMNGKPALWPKKNRQAPVTVPAITIGCRRTRRRLKKPQVVMRFQRSS